MAEFLKVTFSDISSSINFYRKFPLETLLNLTLSIESAIQKLIIFIIEKVMVESLKGCNGPRTYQSLEWFDTSVLTCVTFKHHSCHPHRNLFQCLQKRKVMGQMALRLESGREESLRTVSVRVLLFRCRLF